MKPLNVRELTKQLQTRQQKRNQSFEKVLEICYNSIRRNADKNQLFCFFEVPEFIIGLPVYDLNECILYVVEKLRSNDFLVKYYFPRILYVSWNINEINEEKLQNNLKLIKNIETPTKAPSYKPRVKKQETSITKMPTTVTTTTSSPKASFVKSVKEFKPSGKLVLDI